MLGRATAGAAKQVGLNWVLITPKSDLRFGLNHGNSGILPSWGQPLFGPDGAQLSLGIGR